MLPKPVKSTFVISNKLQCKIPCGMLFLPFHRFKFKIYILRKPIAKEMKTVFFCFGRHHVLFESEGIDRFGLTDR